MLRIFKSVKIQRLRPGLNPRPWVPDHRSRPTGSMKSVIHVYGAIILSDNSYHSILNPFHVTKGSAAFSPIAVCRVPGSMRLNSMYSNLYDVVNSPYLEKVLGDDFRPLADICHI
jgi:hypothetical protein